MTQIKGLHQYLRMEVVWPPADDLEADHAEAISFDVFDMFAGEDENRISIPRIIGDVVLSRGHLLGAYGNTKAHNGDEVNPVDITVLED